ncbi:MAG: MauE/DoxX family redox-associated membrane protein [Micrococcus sp.]|nr:MauE/DoxX family redox-associated membrane protein [Micrococcus sp.]
MSAIWAVSLILIASGLAKLPAPQATAEAFSRLRVPAALARPGLIRAYPVLEILLGLALWIPLTVLRPVFAAIAVVLFIAFLVLVLRGREDNVSCGCFGAASVRPITGLTVLRNILFVLLALAGLLEAIITLAVTGPAMKWWPMAGFTAGAVEWMLVVTLLAVAAAFLIGRETAPLAAEDQTTPAVAPATAAPSAAGVTGSVPQQPAPTQRPAGTVPDADDAQAAGVDGDPPRHPLPSAMLHLPEGYAPLDEYAATQATVFFRLSTGCGSCRQVIAHLAENPEAIGPVALRVLVPVSRPGDTPDTGEIPPELVLHDPRAAAATALGLTTFPSAVLAGTDGLTAGGPVFGAEAVLEFLEEIREAVAEAPEPGQAPA